MELKPGYKQTEVGMIPEDWDCVPIENLAGAVVNAIVGGPFGSDLVSADYVPDGIPVIRGQNMGARYIEGPYAYVSAEKAKYLAANLARPGDIVFTQRGTLGQVSLVPQEPYDWYLISQSQMKVTLHRDKVFSWFLFSWFESAGGQQSIARSAIQTGVPHINLGILKGLRVPLPSVRQQRAIATALSDVDALIAKLDQLIAKKRDLKQAAMQQLLTGKTRLPGFSGEWEVKQLGDLATFHKGKGLPKNALSIDGSEPCVHYGELFTQYGATIGETISRTNKTPNQFRSVANDVLMPTSDVTPRGLAKASCVLFDDLVLGGDILVIRPDSTQISGAFLSRLIRFEDEQVLRLVTGSTVYHLYAADMKKFALRLPSLSEQHAITVALSDMDAEIDALEARCYKTKALKQGMMQALLTGQVRLPIGTELMEALA